MAKFQIEVMGMDTSCNVQPCNYRLKYRSQKVAHYSSTYGMLILQDPEFFLDLIE